MNKPNDLHVRTTDFEQAALRRLAQMERVKVSEFVRNLIRSEAKERGLWDMIRKEQRS